MESFINIFSLVNKLPPLSQEEIVALYQSDGVKYCDGDLEDLKINLEHLLVLT